MGKRGPMPGTGGRPQKALAEKIANGNPGGRPLMVMEFTHAPTLDCVEMPPPKEYMKAQQKNGGKFCAEEIYIETWNWLHDRGCEKLVSTQLISQYAMSVSRWIQCEEAISTWGFLAKHPCTNQAIASPYVSMSQTYMKQVNQIWGLIFQIVKENCSVEYQGSTPQDSTMERLLRARRG
ncbi:MAG: terminase [Candidatus Metalachnospira sp.]|nr:terminase [Candidatus Metalachnospira sp.]